MRTRFFPQIGTAALLLTAAACGPKAPKTDAPSAEERSDKKSAAQPKAVPAEIWKEFRGEAALSHTRAQVECGPRPIGSPELQKARELILAALKTAGWAAELQEFTAETPHGPKTLVNIIARFPKTASGAASTSTQKAIIGSHYDTKIFSTIKFVGANDGASSTGALLELARTAALDPALASQLELVFFDGEEAVQQFTESDGLYGSRYYAAALRSSGRSAQFRFGIVWDMIGDRDLTVTLPIDSPKELTQGVLASAETLGARKNFRMFDRPILDDHVPLNQIARIPTIDIIDFEYDPWHTADDVLRQLSAASLQTVGSVTLHYLKQALP